MIYISVQATFAQSSILNEEKLKPHGLSIIGQLCDYIELMSNSNIDVTTRKAYQSRALKLFINKGETYVEDDVKKEGVYIEINSPYRSKPVRRFVRNYFEGLINNRYSKVTIESTEIANIKVSNLQKINDDIYVCTCYFEQAYCGNKDGREIYKDITRKKVKCYITKEETDDGVEYITRLGDIKAVEKIK